MKKSTTRVSTQDNLTIKRMVIKYMKRHTIQLIAILMLGAPCSLTSCADQNSTVKTSSHTVALVAANSSATYGDPKTDEDMRNADEQWVTHFGWHGNPPLR